MRKIFTIMALLLVASLVQVTAQEKIKKHLINENFESFPISAASGEYLWGFTGDFTNTWIQKSSVAPLNGENIVFRMNGGSGNAIKLGAKFLSDYLDEKGVSTGDWMDPSIYKPGEDGCFYLEFDWMVGEKNNLYTHGNGGYLLFTDLEGKIILGINIEKSGGGSLEVPNANYMHVLNLDPTAGDNDPNNAATRVVTEEGTPTFARDNQWVHIYAVMNFETQKIDSIRIESLVAEGGTPAVWGTKNLDFYDKDAGLLEQFQVKFSNAGNGNGAQYFYPSFDNFELYTLTEPLGDVDITIKYRDEDGQEIRANKVVTQDASVLYTIDAEEKKSFVSNGSYYVYMPTFSQESLQPEVGEANTLTLVYKKVPVTNGTYKWKGFSENWSEAEANFTVDGTTMLGYQNGNAVEFGTEETFFKDVKVAQDIDMGEKNIVFNAAGYSLSGASEITGTGRVIVNADTKLGFTNNMEGKYVEINDAIVEFTSTTVADTIIVNGNESTLINNAKTTLKVPVVSHSKVLNLDSPVGGGNCSFIVSGETETVNITVSRSVRFSGSTGSPNWAETKFPTGAQVNVMTSEVIENPDSIVPIATRRDVFPENKLYLGSNVGLILYYNENNTTPFEIGELSGDETSVIYSGMRPRYWRIGGLNTNSTYAGTFQSYNNSSVATHITKTGTGTLALTGISNNYGTADNTLTVENGTLQLDGVLGIDVDTMYMVSAIVADLGTLSGNGTLYAQGTQIEGTIAGNLTVTGSVVMTGAAKAQIKVNGTKADKLTFPGEFYPNGKLIVTASGNPTPGDYVIFEYGELVSMLDNGFETIELPSDNWSFVMNNGHKQAVLTYKGGDPVSIRDIDSEKEVAFEEYYDITGRKINAKGNGIVITKTVYTDGSVSVSKTMQP